MRGYGFRVLDSEFGDSGFKFRGFESRISDLGFQVSEVHNIGVKEAC